jgi:hypothetical protein
MSLPVRALPPFQLPFSIGEWATRALELPFHATPGGRLLPGPLRLSLPRLSRAPKASPALSPTALQNPGPLVLWFVAGRTFYEQLRSPLPSAEAPAGIDPKHGSDPAPHLPLFGFAW